eukprot:TRINITY_DN212_c0_g1_i1.p2 TRINITY_DN212_c0_g1~~TRINITY_DN212_c0_g1_i1.p2  ORF type:complete len:172 (-),score=56.05 TRINITY_DN212_c0_g1_i1:118-633(-)
MKLTLTLLITLSLCIALVAGKKTNTEGVNLIKSFEGWRSCWYKDAAGYPTIGYGHLIKSSDPYKQGSCITEAQGIALLKKDLSSAENCLNKQIKVNISCNQFAALVSWAFNVGCGASGSSTLMKKLNAGDSSAVPSELLRWNKAGGRVLAGLTRRRQAEGALWKKGGGSGC